MDCEKVEELASAYVDGELLQFDAQMLENHLAECERCRATVEEYRRLRTEMKEMTFAEPGADELRDARPQIVIQVTRGLGWLLTIGFVAVLACFGLYEFITEPGVKALEKVLVLGVILGPVLLFISVLHQRIVDSRTDKYKEVDK